MRHAARLFATGLLVLGAGCAEARPATAAPDVLPLTRVRLYETGVGYFERSGLVRRGRGASLPVPASHLDDALATLVVLTPGHAADPLRAVAFDSRVSRGMARALAGLPTDADAPITYRELLAGLKGARVVVRTRAASLAGRLIDVEGAGAGATDAQSGDGRADEAHAPRPPAGSRLVLWTDDAGLVRVPSGDVRSVRPTDPAYAARLGAALDALSPQAARTGRRLDVLGASSGPVTLAYVAEAPVWRTTYRVVLDPGRGAMLQGWALVHNDTDEDWRDVKLELANGRPDSFLFPFAAPRYDRRELVHPDRPLSTVPQLLGTTADAIWGDQVGDASGEGGLGLTGVGEGGGGYGEGTGLGALGSVGRGRGVGAGREESSAVLAVGDLARVAQAPGVEAGALFVYALPGRLALRAHGSALVPFVQRPVEAEPIAWVGGVGEAARSGVRFVNSTAQTLPAGTVAFFDDGGFSGESALDRLQPGQRRFVLFGADLDVDVSAATDRAGASRDAVERLTYADGTLTEHFLRTTESPEAFENRSGHAKAVYLVLPIGPNAKVTGADAVDYDASSGHPLAVVHVGPRARVERTIATVQGLSRAVPVAQLTGEELTRVLAEPTLAPADRAAATAALAPERDVQDTRRAEARAEADLAAVDKELARLRDDAKAIGGDRGAATGSPELVKRLLAAEDRRTALRARVESLAATEKTRRDAVSAALAKLGR